MQRPAVTALLAAAVLVLAAGCSSGTAPRPDGGVRSTPAPSSPGASASTPAADLPPPKGSVKVTRTVAQGLKSPWGVAPLPDGGLLVASRDEGTVSRIDSAGKQTVIGSVPGVEPGGEGGLLGLALSPRTPRTTRCTRTSPPSPTTASPA